MLELQAKDSTSRPGRTRLRASASIFRLLPEETTEERAVLCTPSDLAGGRAMFTEGSLLGAALTAVGMNPWLAGPAACLIGLWFRPIGTLIHEAQHRKLDATLRLALGSN